jgi:hypothetical protein
VDTVSKLILLGVPNSIEEDAINDTLDKVLLDLESMLLQTDSKYKLTKDQCQNWIKYVVTREILPRDALGGCRGKEEEAEKQQRAACVRIAGVST